MKPTTNPFLNRLMSATLALPLAATAVADTTIPQGLNNIDTAGNPDLGVITRNPGGIAWFNSAGTASATGSSLSNGILGPWAFIGTGTATRFATISNGNITGLSGTSNTWGGTLNSTTANYEITASSTNTYGGSERLANTIRYTGGAGTVISLGDNSSAGLTVNGLINAGTGTITFQHGNNAQAGAGIHIGSTQELVLNAASAAINMNARIHNNGSNPSAVTITGPNPVTLSQANTFTGTLTVTNGSTLAYNNGTLNAASVAGSGAITTTGLNINTNNFTAFTGTFTHNNTTASTTLNTATATSKNAAYHIASSQGSSQGMIAAGAGDYTLEMGSLSGVANSLFRGGNSVSGTTTLQIGNLDTDTTFAGTIANGANKVIAVTKVGSGSLTLSGNSTYTGATVVSAGTLLVSGSLGNSAVSVAAAATIAGTGALAGPLSLDANSFFEVVDISDPLAVAGTITFGSGFGITNLTGIDWASLTQNSPHTVISTTQVFSSSDIANFGVENAASVGGGLYAYFENGSLAVVVIPEPAAAFLGCLGLLGLLRRRR